MDYVAVSAFALPTSNSFFHCLSRIQFRLTSTIHKLPEEDQESPNTFVHPAFASTVSAETSVCCALLVVLAQENYWLRAKQGGSREPKVDVATKAGSREITK